MNQSDFDAPSQIEGLSFDEIDAVNGGGLLAVGAVVVVVGGLLYIGWKRAHENAEDAEG